MHEENKVDHLTPELNTNKIRQQSKMKWINMIKRTQLNKSNNIKIFVLHLFLSTSLGK